MVISKPPQGYNPRGEKPKRPKPLRLIKGLFSLAVTHKGEIQAQRRRKQRTNGRHNRGDCRSGRAKEGGSVKALTFSHSSHRHAHNGERRKILLEIHFEPHKVKVNDTYYPVLTATISDFIHCATRKYVARSHRTTERGESAPAYKSSKSQLQSTHDLPPFCLLIGLVD